MKQTIYILTITIGLLGCNNQPKEADKASISDTTPNKSQTALKIEEICTLNFRRTYAGHENLSEKQLDKLYKENPRLLTNDNPTILTKLNQLNLLENNDLICSMFENRNFTKEYLDNGQKLEVILKNETTTSGQIHLTAKKSNETATKTIDLEGARLIGAVLKDIDNDNVKEILMLSNYYVMNGDNYDLRILKIK